MQQLKEENVGKEQEICNRMFRFGLVQILAVAFFADFLKL
jgi:hypothetical protein